MTARAVDCPNCHARFRVEAPDPIRISGDTEIADLRATLLQLEDRITELVNTLKSERKKRK